MGTSILSTPLLLLWDVLRSLKQQRKRERLSSPPLPTTPTEVVSPSDLEFAQSSSEPIPWLLSQWSTIPHFTEDFTLSEAEQIANRALHFLLKKVTQHRPRNISVEYNLSDRFNLFLSLESQSFSIKTKVVDRLDKTTFDFPERFRL